MFANLQRIRPHQAEQLVIEVTGKSSGVFLWVRLVVMSLLEGLQDGDSITDLQNRLLLLPSDLEDLFKKILNRLNPSYFKQASQIFQLVRAASEPLSLISLSFAEEGFDHCMSAPIKAATKEEIEFCTETTRRRLNSRCKGLLEAPMVETLGPEAKVQYLHRTVKDFLARRDIWEYILSGTENSFDPDLALSGAFLLRVKSTKSNVSRFDVFFHAFIACIEYSLRLETKDRDVHISILNELERTASCALQSPQPGSSHFAWPVYKSIETGQGMIGEDDPRWRNLVKVFTAISLDDTNAFFSYAFKYPLYSYVRHKLSSGLSPNTNIGDNSLLAKAVIDMDLMMMQVLFDCGVSPNTARKGINWTPWHQVLSGAKNDYLRAPTRAGNWADIIKIFLEHGANPWVGVENLSVEALIRYLFQGWDPNRTRELLSTLAAVRKSQKGTNRYSLAFRNPFFKGNKN
jgi:hypothetical protein